MVKKSITVEQIRNQFNLDIIAGETELQREITQAKVHRPGLEFVGYFDFFPMNLVQILGQKEITFLQKLSDAERKMRIGNIVNYHPPCFIVTSGQTGLTYLKQYCSEERIPLLVTEESTEVFIAKLATFMSKVLAEETVVHGVCVNVSGIGILLRGKSGVGKSETAHTLIGRGHRLVADDMVILKKLSQQTLLGTHNEINKEFLALRSIGLLNIVRMYGQKAYQEETRIALDIELSKWEDKHFYNDLELKPKFSEYMGVKIPHIQIQLQPGRDVVGLIEAAANNWHLHQQGYSAMEEFTERIKKDS